MLWVPTVRCNSLHALLPSGARAQFPVSLRSRSPAEGRSFPLYSRELFTYLAPVGQVNAQVKQKLYEEFVEELEQFRLYPYVDYPTFAAHVEHTIIVQVFRLCRPFFILMEVPTRVCGRLHSPERLAL